MLPEKIHMYQHVRCNLITNDKDLELIVAQTVCRGILILLIDRFLKIIIVKREISKNTFAIK